MKRILIRFAKIVGVAAAALLVIGIIGGIFGLGQDDTTATDDTSPETTVEAVDEADKSEPATTAEPSAEPEQNEPATTEPEPEPRPESELKQGNETAYLSAVDSLAKSDEFPWLTEDSPILAGNDVDEWLVVFGYGICENLEALEQPVTYEAMDADIDAYAESQGYSVGEMGALYVSTEHLCPKAYEKLPES